MLRVARYRFRTTFRIRWGGLLAIVLLVGLMGGLSLGAIAGARRTQSSFPTFLASTNPSDLTLQAFGVNNGQTQIGSTGDTSPAVLRAIAHLPHVRHTASEAILLAGPLEPNGAPNTAALQANFQAIGSLNGLGFTQDRVIVVKGRMANQSRADQVVMTAGAARILGVHIGDTFEAGAFTIAQIASPGFGTTKVRTTRRVKVTVVGIIKLSTSVVQDDVDAAGGQFALFTPAYSDALAACCGYGTYTGIQIDRRRNITLVENEIARILPKGTAFYFEETPVAIAKAERAIKPEAIALGVFGAVAMLATLLIAGQAIGRQLRSGSDELDALRAIGAGPATTSTDGLVGVVGAVLLGALLAAAVAVVLSPLAPLGPVRHVYPARGVAIDWAALGLGALLLVAVLSASALVLAYRTAPHRLARRLARTSPRTSRIAHSAAASGLPASAVAGVRFALESGNRNRAVPMRSAIVGTALAVVVVIGTLTFGSSLRTLVSHPALYGWNFTYELDTSNGGSGVNGTQAAKLLDHDADVAAWTGVYFDSLRLDGQTVPILGEKPRPAVAPPLLSGHGFTAPDEIVVGADTLAQLHKHIGDTVQAVYGHGAATRVRIVGTATMPTLGQSEELHPTMGTGALVDYELIPSTTRNPDASNAFDPSAVFVRIRSTTSPAAALTSLRRIATSLGSRIGGPVSVVSVERPAEIVNYRSMGSTPALLGAALAAGAAAGLALTLLTSVRRRRHDLALLKTLGFTRRQLAATVAWQSTVAVVIGTVIGIPIGLLVGRSLWDQFARELHVVAQPTIPAFTVVSVAVGAVVLANLVAAIPGRQAANTETAVLLRAE
jgi:hypothetical protein